MLLKILELWVLRFYLIPLFIIKTCLCSSCTYVKIESAGLYEGLYAAFMIDSIFYNFTALDGYRGFNILVLDSSNLSKITTEGCFDTFASKNANVDMKNFIES